MIFDIQENSTYMAFHQYGIYNELLVDYQIPPLTICARKTDLDTYITSVHPEQRKWKMEDLPMALWFSKFRKIHFLNKDLGVYRSLADSLSHPQKMDERLAFHDSCKDVRLYFAGNNRKSVQKIQMRHERIKGNIYLAFNDLKQFRTHNLKGGIRGFLEIMISYCPGGQSFLRRMILDKYTFV